jgi:hypothetical protein
MLAETEMLLATLAEANVPDGNEPLRAHFVGLDRSAVKTPLKVAGPAMVSVKPPSYTLLLATKPLIVNGALVMFAVKGLESPVT